MISVIYASFSVLWIIWLALQVVKARRKTQIAYGDGGVEALLITRSAHSNATETIPIMLILLFGLELNGGHIWLIHLLGILMMIARGLHGKGILTKRLKPRKRGMELTVFVMVALVVANIIYLPFDQLI